MYRNFKMATKGTKIKTKNPFCDLCALCGEYLRAEPVLYNPAGILCRKAKKHNGYPRGFLKLCGFVALCEKSFSVNFVTYVPYCG